MKSVIWRLGLALVLLLTLGGVLGTRSIQAAEAPWLNGWANRIPLTIDHTRLSATLTNYPVLVHLSAASGLTRANTASVFTALGLTASSWP